MMTPDALGQEKRKGEMLVSLPAQVEGWKWDGEEKIYNHRTIFDYINGAGELYLAYNFRSVKVRRFEKPGQPSIIVELFDMGSSEDAYGVFSFERQDEDAGVGQESELGGGLLRFWKGNFFVSLYAEGESPEIEPALLRLGRAVANSIKTTGPKPKLARALPNGKEGLVEKTIRYLQSHVLLNQRFFIASQNILNLNKETEAVLAQYLRDQKKVHLLVVHYRTEKQAQAALESFKKVYMPEALPTGLVRTEDRKWTGARRQKEFVLIVFGAASKEEVEKLIEATQEKLGEK